MFKIDWLTDLHLPSLHFRASDMSAAEQRDMRETIIKGATTYVMQAVHDTPDIVVNTGDNIDTTASADEDICLQSTVMDIFNPLGKIMQTLPGNHDVRHSAAIDIAARFNFISKTRMIETPDATLVFWLASVAPHYPHIRDPRAGAKRYHKSFTATREEINELRDTIERTRSDKPVLLFSHVPLTDDPLQNPVDHDETRNPHRSFYKNNNLIHKELRYADRRIFIFSGHRHVNREIRIVKNVRLFTMDRAVRWEDMGPLRPKGVNNARIEVGKNKVTVTRRGVMPYTREFSI